MDSGSLGQTQGGRIGLYPGTFDPVTHGHMEIIKRATKIVDRLVVGVAGNDGKGPFFDVRTRVAMIEDEIRELPETIAQKVEVKSFETLLLHFACAEQASVIVRGLRAVSDFEYEIQMAAMNYRINQEIETVFLMATEGNQFVSSRFVKEIARLGGNIDTFVSPSVANKLKSAFPKA